MTLKETKNRIIDNPFSSEDIEDFIAGSEEKRYLGKSQTNYVKPLTKLDNFFMDNTMKKILPFEGLWWFEFFHQEQSVLYHNDIIEGNRGSYGCIIPLQWEGHDPATIMYNYWETQRRIMYTGSGQCSYKDTGEIVKDLNISELKEELVFEWSKDKIFIFDVYQLHSARPYTNGWKEFLIGFLT